MGIVNYALLIYALTAIISIVVVGIIVLVNKIISKKEMGEKTDE